MALEGMRLILKWMWDRTEMAYGVIIRVGRFLIVYFERYQELYFFPKNQFAPYNYLHCKDLAQYCNTVQNSI